MDPPVQEVSEEQPVIPKKRGPYKKKGEKERDRAERERMEALARLSPLERLEEALKGSKDAPNRVTLQEWKDLHGKFYMSSTDGENIFIWKTIKRTEYKSILTSGVMDKPQMLEEFVVRRSLLWPKPTQDWMTNSDAGIISTLFKQIYDKSGFISDEMALNLVEKI